MKRIGTAPLLVAIAGGGWIVPANAAPPTVTPSPGYDARLQEQHAQVGHEVLGRDPQPPIPHRGARHHHRAH